MTRFSILIVAISFIYVTYDIIKEKTLGHTRNMNEYRSKKVDHIP